MDMVRVSTLLKVEITRGTKRYLITRNSFPETLHVNSLGHLGISYLGQLN